jgi:DNA-binding response OmpR family regulator
MANKKILIVEDDPDVRQGLSLRLRANGYDIFFAGDVVTSLIEARKHPPATVSS